MSQFLAQRDLFDNVLHLNEEEKADPMLVIERFFGDYRLHECRHQLWTMVETCLTTDNDGFNNASDRGNLLLHYRDLERLLEAAAVLMNKRPRETPRAGLLPGPGGKKPAGKSKPA
ncbi:MAG TPA: hypothetical protein VKU83_04660 [Puia sp.]|nr:hypothetical protein [Puia sp.]